MDQGRIPSERGGEMKAEAQLWIQSLGFSSASMLKFRGVLMV